ncbi:hypothetical protein TUMEXPCC7403_21225 [Tumidithrix helvetica PCC 7403]
MLRELLDIAYLQERVCSLRFLEDLNIYGAGWNPNGLLFCNAIELFANRELNQRSQQTNQR